MKANHTRYGQLEIISIIDNNIIEVRLADGSEKKLPLAFTILIDDSGNKITDFSSILHTTSAPVVFEVKSDEEVNAWKNKPAVEMIELNVVRESEKAVAIQATSTQWNRHTEKWITDNKLVWIPKSMVTDGKASKWFVEDKIASLTTFEKGIYKTYSI